MMRRQELLVAVDGDSYFEIGDDVRMLLLNHNQLPGMSQNGKV